MFKKLLAAILVGIMLFLSPGLSGYQALAAESLTPDLAPNTGGGINAVPNLNLESSQPINLGDGEINNDLSAEQQIVVAPDQGTAKIKALSLPTEKIAAKPEAALPTEAAKLAPNLMAQPLAWRQKVQAAVQKHLANISQKVQRSAFYSNINDQAAFWKTFFDFEPDYALAGAGNLGGQWNTSPKIASTLHMAVPASIPRPIAVWSPSYGQVSSGSNSNAPQSRGRISAALANLKKTIAAWRGRLVGGTPAPLFSIKEIDGKRMIEIRPDQLDKSYLFFATIEAGTGEKGLFAEEMADSFLWYFHREGNKIQFKRQNSLSHAQDKTPEYYALKQSFPDSTLATIPITKTSWDSIYISADDLFAQDLVDILGRMRKTYQSLFAANGDGVRAADSNIDRLQAFANNMEVKVQKNFITAASDGSVLPDSRFPTVEMHYSLTAIPESPNFVPRAADDRIGFFTTPFLDYSRKDLAAQDEPVVRYINRWNLQKKDPQAEVSEVVKPIVYWLDRSVPERFRPEIKTAILVWNVALAAVGFKNALVVKEVDKDMTAEELAVYDPADITDNVVTWFMANGAGFAEGPSRVNPLTGEIIKGEIRIDDIMTRSISDMAQYLHLNGNTAQSSLTVNRLLSQLQKDVAQIIALPAGIGNKLQSHDNPYADYSKGMTLQMAHGVAFIISQPALSAVDKAAALEKLTSDYVTHFVMHEMGHNLGLRHNMASSSTIANDKLGAGEAPLTNSLMDYLPINIAPEGQPQGPYFQTTLGAYDLAAIHYGYLPLKGDEAAQKAQLKGIADTFSRDPRLKYGTDEDMMLGADPDVQVWTLGDDVVAFEQSRLTDLAQPLLNRLKNMPLQQGESYAPLIKILFTALNLYPQAIKAVLPVIGGIYSRRVRFGDAQAPFEVVPVEDQRRALKFLDENILNMQMDFPPQLLARLAPDRLDTKFKPAGPIPMDQIVLKIQKMALAGLFDASRLQRLAQSQALVARPEDVLPLKELMETVRKSIWRELEDPNMTAIPAPRRNLQLAYLEALGNVDSPPPTGLMALFAAFMPQPPNEAKNIAASEKTALKDLVQKALLRKDKLDQDTLLYLQKLSTSLY